MSDDKTEKVGQTLAASGLLAVARDAAELLQSRFWCDLSGQERNLYQSLARAKLATMTEHGTVKIINKRKLYS